MEDKIVAAQPIEYGNRSFNPMQIEAGFNASEFVQGILLLGIQNGVSDQLGIAKAQGLSTKWFLQVFAVAHYGRLSCNEQYG
jgi:hypothetical protein